MWYGRFYNLDNARIGIRSLGLGAPPCAGLERYAQAPDAGHGPYADAPTAYWTARS
jgi:hypothetical protein